MKKLLVLAALGVAAWLGYTHFVAPRNSAGGQRVADLEARLDTAVHRFHQASRGAAISGVDTTSDAEAARAEIDSVAREADALQRAATSEDEKAGAAHLRGKVREAREAIGER